MRIHEALNWSNLWGKYMSRNVCNRVFKEGLWSVWGSYQTIQEKILTQASNNSGAKKLTFNLFTLRFLGIFLSPYCIYVWNIWKPYVEKNSSQVSCQNHSVDIVQLWPRPLLSWPKNVNVRGLPVKFVDSANKIRINYHRLMKSCINRYKLSGIMHTQYELMFLNIDWFISH